MEPLPEQTLDPYAGMHEPMFGKGAVVSYERLALFFSKVR